MGMPSCFIHDKRSYASTRGGRRERGRGWDLRHKQAVAASLLPRLTMKWRVPYSNDGERRERWREERYSALQQGSKTLQSVPAQQIEPITERGIFSFKGLSTPHPPPHLICQGELEFTDQSAKKEVLARILAFQVLLGLTFREGSKAFR